MLAALSQAIEARDPYTRGHSARVTALAYAVGLRLGWSIERLATLRVGGALHDVGKLSISPLILRKPGPLTEEEMGQIRAHPAVGARLIERVAAARPALPYVLHHHERWDGAGYPSGLGGEEIPIEGRLLAVADAFDAMTSNRPYRAPLAPTDALRELARCAGTQFDPGLADAFCEVWGAPALDRSRSDFARRVTRAQEERGLPAPGTLRSQGIAGGSTGGGAGIAARVSSASG